MTIIARQLHSTDTQLSEREIRRTIGNYINYQKPNGRWHPSNNNAELAVISNPPDDLDGPFDFHNFRDGGGPVEMFAVDRNSGAAICGMRLSRQPKTWIKFIPIDAALGITPIFIDVKTITWPELWPGIDLTWEGRPQGIKDVLLVKELTAPVPRFKLKLSAGLSATLDQITDTITIRNASGDAIFVTRPPYGIDAIGSSVRINIRGDDVDIDGSLKFRIVGNASDMATAVFPIKIDPITNISGIVAIDDQHIVGSAPDSTFGTASFVGVGTIVSGGGPERGLFRLTSAASIPTGIITEFVANLTQLSASSSNANPGTAKIFLVKDANVWVEGTTFGASQVGSSCWNKLIYNTTNWTGSVGCGTPDTDYYATDPAYPSTSIPINVYPNLTLTPWHYALPPIFATHWRDGIRARNGIIIISDTEASPLTSIFWRSTEFSSVQPTFDITYSTAKPLFFFVR